MRKMTLMLVGLALAGGISACANNYGIPPGGPHYASWDHLGYSFRGGEKPALSKQEYEAARKEGWWGTPVVYTVDELE